MTFYIKRLLLIILCVEFFTLTIHAQNRWDITLDTQAEVDAFDPSQLYNLGVYIEGNDITNVDHLANFTYFNSLVIQNCPNLVSVDGLSNVTSLVSLAIINNDQLSSIDGLANITMSSFPGNIIIEGNAALTSLPAFTGITVVDGDIRIVDNPEVMSVGFTSVESITGALAFSGNPKLTSLPDFSTLKSARSIFIYNMPVTSLNGFPSVERADDITVSNNAELEEISGFPALQQLGILAVDGNPKLTAINGFDQLTELVTSGGRICANDFDR